MSPKSPRAVTSVLHCALGSLSLVGGSLSALEGQGPDGPRVNPRSAGFVVEGLTQLDRTLDQCFPGEHQQMG